MRIMLHRVNLWDIEVGVNLLLDKDILVRMKTIPRVFKFPKRVICMRFEVRIIYKIEDSTCRLNDFRMCCPGDNAQKHLLHVFVLISGPLGDERYPLLEMTKAGMPCHRLETSVNLAL